MKKDRKTLSFRGAGKTLSGSSYAAKIQHFFCFHNTFEEKNQNFAALQGIGITLGARCPSYFFQTKKIFSNYVIIYFLSIFAF